MQRRRCGRSNEKPGHGQTLMTDASPGRGLAEAEHADEVSAGPDPVIEAQLLVRGNVVGQHRHRARRQPGGFAASQDLQ